MAKKLSVFNKILKLRERYYESCQGKHDLLKIISETEVGEQVYNSNAIENSTLTLDETERILQEIDLDRFIKPRELFEAKNLARVVNYIDKKAKESELTIDILLLLHKMLLSNINDDIAGRYRKEGEWVKVGFHIAPDPREVELSVLQTLATYYANPSDHIIKRIALFHLNFENIHPFVDGNGRIGRVLNNYLLIREGYVPINIRFKNRETYYSAFREYDNFRETHIMEEVVGKALTNSYHKRLAYLENKNIVTLKEYAKAIKASHANVINKANRQTIEAFIDKGIWKIGL